MQLKIEIIKKTKNWSDHKKINKIFCKKLFKIVLSRYDIFKNCNIIESSILLTTDEELRELNKKFRSIDKPTNVLSFPYTEIKWNQTDVVINKEIYLGDIAVSYEKILNESKNYSIEFENYFTHLLVHSILHLIGYDHIHESDRILMESVETKILQEMNIESPYND